MTKKILLIDDSLTQLGMLKNKLENSGFEVDTAQDGYSGYKSVYSSTPDVILSDIIMPNLNGFQLCRLLKNSEQTKEIPIILLTVLDKKVDRFWANKSGADKFIPKTADYEEIISAINEITERYPVSQDYKEKLKTSEKTLEAVQYEINDIFDSLLMNSTFLSEFRVLGKHVRHEKVLVTETFKLLNSFVDYDLAGLFLSNIDKNDKNILQLDVSKIQISKFALEKIKRDFFDKMHECAEFSSNDFGFNIVMDFNPENAEDNSNAVLNVNNFKSVFIYPLYDDNKLYGGICFYRLEEMDYTKCKFYQTMIDELMLLLKMRYIYSETEYFSVTDGLTGLYNRRHFNTNVEREFLRVRRYHSELSLAMIDIDYFKNVNDTYGHQFGDFVLKEIADIIQASFRKTDMIYRYGGEELVIILPETTMENAFIPMERLREKIAAHEFVFNGETIHTSISVGIGCYNDTVKSSQMLIESTDGALYEAKEAGRNRVILAKYEQSDNDTK